MKGGRMESVGSQKGLKPFTTVVFGDYAAQKNGDKVTVMGKDGSYQVMEMKEFVKFLAANLPQIRTQPKCDTFQKAAV